MKNKRHPSGQAAIEFVAIMVVVFFFLLFFLSLSIVIVTSEYLEYATFMAARTYKSGMGSRQTQEDRARTVLNTYAQRVDTIARNFQTTFSEDGVSLSYDINIFYLPPVFINNGNQPVSRIRLSTESRLGRDPSFEECRGFFQNLLTQFGVTNPTFLEYVDDSTC